MTEWIAARRVSTICYRAQLIHSCTVYCCNRENNKKLTYLISTWNIYDVGRESQLHSLQFMKDFKCLWKTIKAVNLNLLFVHHLARWKIALQLFWHFSLCDLSERVKWMWGALTLLSGIHSFAPTRHQGNLEVEKCPHMTHHEIQEWIFCITFHLLLKNSRLNFFFLFGVSSLAFMYIWKITKIT